MLELEVESCTRAFFAMLLTSTATLVHSTDTQIMFSFVSPISSQKQLQIKSVDINEVYTYFVLRSVFYKYNNTLFKLHAKR